MFVHVIIETFDKLLLTFSYRLFIMCINIVSMGCGPLDIVNKFIPLSSLSLHCLNAVLFAEEMRTVVVVM